MSQLLVVVIAGIGAPVGAYIGSCAKSELKEGWFNVNLFSTVLLALITFFVASNFTTGILPVVLALLVGGAFSYYDIRAKKPMPPLLVVPMLALVLINAFNRESFPVIASLVFMYCVTASSLGNWKQAAYRSALFLATAAVIILAMSF
jgi:hypothetical protein